MTLCLLFSSCAVNVSFSHSVLCHIFHIFGVFFFVIMLCKIDPQDTLEVPASVAKCKKTAVCLLEKIGVSDKLASGMSCSAVGHEFTVNQLYILNKVLKRSTHKTKNILIS